MTHPWVRASGCREDPLAETTVAVVGYGSQGRAQASNLRDAGVDVIVGARPEGDSWQRAQSDGHTVLEIPEAVRAGEVVLFLLPDEVHRDVYQGKIRENLDEGDLLVFAHGFSVWSGQIDPPQDVDVALVAPKAPGAKVREAFQDRTGVPVLIAVQQDATGQAAELTQAIARAVGADPDRMFETTVAEETETDLFGEQAVLCGGLTRLVQHGFETLVDAGYQPEVVYHEVLKELKLIVDLVDDGGLEHMWSNVSNTAEYGGRTRGPEVVDEHVKANMEALLAEIRAGTFADEWLREQAEGCDQLEELRARADESQIERVGRRVRNHAGSPTTGGRKD